MSGERWQAAYQHAGVADGMNPVLSTHAPAFFVASCQAFPASSPAGSPNETLFF